MMERSFNDAHIQHDVPIRTTTLSDEIKFATMGIYAIATRYQVDVRYLMRMIENELKAEGLLD